MIVAILILLLSICVSLIGAKDSDAIIMYYDCVLLDNDSSVSGLDEIRRTDSDYTPISVDIGNATSLESSARNTRYSQDNRPAALDPNKEGSNLNSVDDIESALKADDPVTIAESTYQLFFSDGGKSNK